MRFLRRVWRWIWGHPAPVQDTGRTVDEEWADIWMRRLFPQQWSRTQGTNDLFVGLASASISLGSGFLFGAIGYAGITAIAGGLALIPLVMSVNFMRTSRVAAAA